jgi:Protein of unknown function with HXXEE motif
MTTSRTRNSSLRLWLYLLVYPLHAIEEVRGIGVLHGINLSSTAFFAFSGAAVLALVIAIVLSQRFRFPQFLEIILGTAVIANATSHIVNSIAIGGYDAGVITGTLLFIPLGVATLISSRKSMRPLRYIAAGVLGLVMQGVIMIIAW